MSRRGWPCRGGGTGGENQGAPACSESFQAEFPKSPDNFQAEFPKCLRRSIRTEPSVRDSKLPSEPLWLRRSPRFLPGGFGIFPLPWRPGGGWDPHAPTACRAIQGRGRPAFQPRR